MQLVVVFSFNCGIMAMSTNKRVNAMSLRLPKSVKDNINARVLLDCPLNGHDIVVERMLVKNWEIKLGESIIEIFKGDSYDVQQRKAELQRIVSPIQRTKMFSVTEHLLEV